MALAVTIFKVYLLNYFILSYLRRKKVLEVNLSDCISISSKYFIRRVQSHDICNLSSAYLVRLSVIVTRRSKFLIKVFVNCILIISWIVLLSCHILAGVDFVVYLDYQFWFLQVRLHPKWWLILFIILHLKHLKWLYETLGKDSIHQFIVWSLILPRRAWNIVW